MKKIYCLLVASLLMPGCMQEDIYNQVPGDTEYAARPKGRLFVLNQNELLKKYPQNGNLQSVLENGFKQSSFLPTTLNDSAEQYGIEIDLDHIQVYEAPQMHAITYTVMMEPQHDGQPQELYNLVYFSTDYVQYYVTLLRYDFSQIPFLDFISNPGLTPQLLSFFPLNDIDNIYENIKYSISRPSMQTYGAVNHSLSVSFINITDCARTVVVEGTLCKGSGMPKHQYGEDCSMTGNKRATPGYSYMDFSDCRQPNPVSGSGSSVGAPGAGGGSGAGPGTPVKAYPVKEIDDFKRSGAVFLQINIGNTDYNLKMLKTVSSLFIDDIKELSGKLNDIKEYGYGYNLKKANGLFGLINKFRLPNPAGVNTSVDMENVFSYYYGILHSHPENIGSLSKKGSPLFSAPDLGALFKFANKTTAKPDKIAAEAFIGAVNKYGLYMVMLPNEVTQANIATKYADFVKVNTIGNTVRADYDKPKWDKLADELISKYQKIENNLNENEKKEAHETALLKILEEFELDVNIYFLDKNGGSFNGSWQKLSLNNGRVQYTNL